MKKNILIYGSGNIGIRHAQSLIGQKDIKKIYMFDISMLSINNAKNFFKNNKHKNKLVFTNSIKMVENENFFLCIICTYAYDRIKTLKTVKKNIKIKFIICEKILDTNIANLRYLNFNNKNVYVNFPLREMKIFKIIKEKLKLKKINAKISGNWHMLCNALHYVNFVSYLTNSKIKMLEIKNLHSKYNLSRKNFIDYHGEINAEFNNKSKLKILSIEKSKKFNFELLNKKQKINLDLNYNHLTIDKKKFSYKKEYQSNLTKNYFLSLSRTGKLNLPKINDVIRENYLFLKSLHNIFKNKKNFKKIT